MMVRPLGHDGRILLTVSLGLLAVGVMAVYSASSFASMKVFGNSHHYVTGHILRIVIGLLLGAAVYSAGPRVWKAAAMPLYLISIICLIPTVLIGSSLAPAINGSSRWLVLGPIRFMPSELSRFSFVLLAATLVSGGKVSARTPRGFLVLALLAAVPAGLIIAQPDFAGAIYMLAMMAVVLYLAEARFSHMILLFGAIALLGTVFVLTSSYRLERVRGWVYPTAGVDDENFQPQQSCIALGSGGLFGRGLGHGRQQRGFLPEAFSDFILAVIGEEAGMIGTSLILLAFCVLLWTGWRIAERADDFFGSLLSGGVTASIAIGSLLHIAVATRLLPTTGVTLPLISWGGTSVVFTMVAISLAARISAESSR